MSFKTAAFTLIMLIASAGAAVHKRAQCPNRDRVTNIFCCTFASLRDDLQQNLFGGECNENVHGALRLAFSDAIGFSKSRTAFGGGADGSIITFADIETAFAANIGLDGVVANLVPFLDRHPVSAGDLVQFAAAVGITNCPGAPQLTFLAGRPEATAPANEGIIPKASDTTTKIFSRMNDAGFSPADLVRLLAAHSIGHASHVDPTIANVPFDTTPFTFDSQFYLEVLLKGTVFPGTSGNPGEVLSPLAGEMRLKSDLQIARDPRTACAWQSMITASQANVQNGFKSAMGKLAVLGQNTTALIDCSEVIPQPQPAVNKRTTFPAGTNSTMVRRACASMPFPSLSADSGSPTQIPACPDGSTNPEDCPS